jgi:hypothetical protein
MTKPFPTWVLSVSGVVLALAASVYAQTPDGSEPAEMEAVSPGPLNPSNALVDLVFTPITPCRIINTTVSGGPITAGSTRNFVVAGTTGFVAQGGNPTGCGIPRGPAVAAVINYVAVNPAGAGDLRVTPFGTAVPLASVINYAAVPGLNIANGVATKLCTPGVSCSLDITIQADSSATGLVADVMGYYSSVTCQAGTVQALGQCFETASRAADNLFAASDTCRSAMGPVVRLGGRLATPMELRSLRGGVPLTLDAAGEWVDSFNVSAAVAVGILVTNAGTLSQVGVTSLHPFRCVFRTLP